jgi:four helix bundle protein
VNTKQFDLRQRTKSFSLAAMRLCRDLPGTMEARVIANQLLRSATSVGANYRAVQRSRSRAEFVSKMGVVIEEADESLYWLELIRDSHLLQPDAIREAVKEAEELVSIFVASQLTARNKARSEN